VRSGRGEDQRIRRWGERPGQLVVKRGGVGEVVGLVDDHDVPALLLEATDVVGSLQGVHRDDDALVVRERVARRRQLLAHSLEARAIQADERQSEAAPHFVLHLSQHVLGRDDQNPLSTTATDQLGQDHADLDGLAEADRVRE
jgi:hypothetical protein